MDVVACRFGQRKFQVYDETAPKKRKRSSKRVTNDQVTTSQPIPGFRVEDAHASASVPRESSSSSSSSTTQTSQSTMPPPAPVPAAAPNRYASPPPEAQSMPVSASPPLRVRMPASMGLTRSPIRPTLPFTARALTYLEDSATGGASDFSFSMSSATQGFRSFMSVPPPAAQPQQQPLLSSSSSGLPFGTISTINTTTPLMSFQRTLPPSSSSSSSSADMHSPRSPPPITRTFLTAKRTPPGSPQTRAGPLTPTSPISFSPTRPSTFQSSALPQWLQPVPIPDSVTLARQFFDSIEAHFQLLLRFGSLRILLLCLFVFAWRVICMLL